ncbi:unnamed protein product [Oncorhynchus mykiss]|uniref:Lipocalin/cytosolic fatty-acid binding domain-containing protein n=1 Tax=Oncorhynchus mykiss TaxID=8022 RepID=A0A060Y3J9_ONCMY|nr:unnamed protein product [Oncorhynchus mykiss]
MPINHKASMKMGNAVLTPTADGDQEMTYPSRNADGSCWRMNHLAKKTNLLGKFIYKSERWSNENDMRVVDVKYDEYALIHTKTKVYLVCHVLYRGTDLSPSLLQKFRQFSLDTGYPPPKNGTAHLYNPFVKYVYVAQYFLIEVWNVSDIVINLISLFLQMSVLL